LIFALAKAMCKCEMVARKVGDPGSTVCENERSRVLGPVLLNQKFTAPA
jgi:hypothetical protein